MAKRIASATIWFLAAGWALNYLTVMMDVPSAVGLVIAAAISAVIGFDPLHLVWPVGETAPKIASAPAPHAVHSLG